MCNQLPGIDNKNIHLSITENVTHPRGGPRKARASNNPPGPLNLPPTGTILGRGVREVVTLRPARAGAHYAEPEGGTTGRRMSKFLRDVFSPGGYRGGEGSTTEFG